MQLKFFLLSTLLTLAAAQSSGSAPAATTTTSLNPVQTCLNTCTLGDVNCEAACVGVPHPGAQQMNQTTECVGNCDQGDGSPAASQKYAECRNACISSYILTSTAGGAVIATGSAQASAATASATRSAASAAASMSAMASSAASSVSRTASAASHSGTATESAGASTSSGVAASNGPLGASFVGVVGLLLGAFVL